MSRRKPGRRRNAETSHRLARLLEGLRPKLAKEDEELADELGVVIERLSAMPSHVSDAKLIELRAAGETYRGIGEIVGLDFTAVYKRLQKPANRAKWAALQEKALIRAGLVHERNLVDLAETEVAIALGVIPGESPQVSALNNALGRAGLAKLERIDLTATMESTTALLIKELGADETVSRADEVLRRRGGGEPAPLKVSG